MVDVNIFDDFPMASKKGCAGIAFFGLEEEKFECENDVY
jgi:hypothetical protein